MHVILLVSCKLVDERCFSDVLDKGIGGEVLSPLVFK